MLPGQGRQGLFLHRMGKALDAVIAGVHLHQQGGALADGGGVVFEMGAVGGADLHQMAAGAGHDFRYPERAADLHQFPPGGRDFAPQGQAIEDEEDCRRIVVDHCGRFRTRQFADQGLHMTVALAPLAARQIELQGRRRRGDSHHRRHRFPRQQSAAKVGMEDSAGQIEDRPQAGLVASMQLCRHPLPQSLGGDLDRMALIQLLPGLRQCSADRLAHLLMAPADDGVAHLLQPRIHRG